MRGPIDWYKIFSPTAAEARLLEILRDDHRQHFRLMITRHGNRWQVEKDTMEFDAPSVVTGIGESLSDAWSNLKPDRTNE